MIAIIKYNAGNVQSVQYALQRIGVESIVTDDAKTILESDKIIFPGVGHANAAMEYLKAKELDKLLIQLKQPVLGICLGMQLLCNYSEEGETKCLGVFDTDVKLFSSQTFKIPEVGWNTIDNYDSELFSGIIPNSFVYGVHSYYAEMCDNTIATTDYVLKYSAALQHNNFYGVQFHPEKSADVGEQILKNFIQL